MAPADWRELNRKQRQADQAKEHLTMDRVQIFDTTLRDGEQSPGISLNASEKLEIAQQLARLGVDVIEAGFPIASPGDFEAVQTIAREVDGPVIAGLARASSGRHRGGLRGGTRRSATAHPHLHLDVGHPHQAPAAEHARGRPGPVAGRGRARASRSSTTSSSRRWTPRAPTWIHRRGDRHRHRGGRDDDQRARHGRLRAARRVRRLPDRPVRARASAARRRAVGALPRRPGVGRGQLVSPASARAPARWSARSTASASGPATRRSRRS